MLTWAPMPRMLNSVNVKWLPCARRRRDWASQLSNPNRWRLLLESPTVPISLFVGRNAAPVIMMGYSGTVRDGLYGFRAPDTQTNSQRRIGQHLTHL
jgi:hypothetical protein